jgi:hypothetical protein
MMGYGVCASTFRAIVKNPGSSLTIMDSPNNQPGTYFASYPPNAESVIFPATILELTETGDPEHGYQF